MKNLFVLAVLALLTAGCASNNTASADASAETQAEGTPPEMKKSCTYERTRGGSSRLQRVCTYGDGG